MTVKTTAQPQRRAVSIKFETTTCDRCGGSGYMPYAAYGGVCFKCNKAGVVYTRAGRAVRLKGTIVTKWVDEDGTPLV
jgi:DnaJ-class molecular chaperone